MLNLTMLLIGITQSKSNFSSSIQVTFQYAWTNNRNNNQESPTYDDCNENYRHSVSLFNRIISTTGGENC
jgi:hypothetical protein